MSVDREKKEAEFGEKIYEVVDEYYPEKSESVTGMLLEADYDELRQLVSTTAGREELVNRIHIAARSLNALERENCKENKNEDYGFHDMNEKPNDLDAEHSHFQEKSKESAGQCDVPEKKQALGETLFSLIENKHPTDAERLTGILLEMDVQSLELLIKDTDLLENKIEEVMECLQNFAEPNRNGEDKVILETDLDKTVIGEELYDLVCSFSVEHADKITGMLLEMDLEDLKIIVKDNVALEEKVTLALEALNNQIKESEVTTSVPEKKSDKTLIGEKLYHLICEWYPDHADKITGMLLELDVKTLDKLLEDPEALKDKASLAANALYKTNSQNEITCSLDERRNGLDSEIRHCSTR